MKQLNINLSYNVKYPEGTAPADITKAQGELTKMYIDFAITSAHRDGLDSQFRRLYASIEKKINAALEDGSYLVDLTEGEFQFIKAAFDNKDAKFSPSLAQYVIVLEDELIKIGASNK